MALVRQYHKDTGTTYVLTNERYWDPEAKKTRSRRKIIGKIDPETGEIIPTGKKSEGEEITGLTERVRELEIQNNELQTRVNLLERENMKLRAKSEDAVQLRSDNKRMKSIIKEARSSAFEILRLFGTDGDTEEVLHIETAGNQGQCEGGVERA